MRILILVIAMFFAAGFVSAQTESESTPALPVNPNAYTLKEISAEGNVTGYVWTAPGKPQTDSDSGDSAGYSISVNVVRLDAASDWSYTAFDKNDPDTKWELCAEVKENGQSVPNPYLLSSNDVYNFIEEPVKDENGNDVLDDDGNVRTERKQGDLALRVYSFSLPVEAGKSKAPVIAVRNNVANVSSDSNVATENGELFYKMSETSLAFGIAPKPENGEEPKPDAIITIGQPLPSSVVTLLVGLGFCAALVLYRKYRRPADCKCNFEKPPKRKGNIEKVSGFSIILASVSVSPPITRMGEPPASRRKSRKRFASGLLFRLRGCTFFDNETLNHFK